MTLHAYLVDSGGHDNQLLYEQPARLRLYDVGNVLERGSEIIKIGKTRRLFSVTVVA